MGKTTEIIAKVPQSSFYDEGHPEAPPEAKAGASQARGIDDQYLTKRSNSNVIPRPSFTPGYFNTILQTDDSTNVPVIPESLPTTPGFELESGGMFANSTTRLNSFPNQQQVPTKKLAKGKKITGSPSIYEDGGEDEGYEFHVIGDPESPIVDDAGSDNKDTHPTMMTLSNPPMNRWRLLASCFWCFNGGISDGCIGPLLPNIESYYNISYSIVSLIWLGNCIGFILVASTSHLVSKRLGLHFLVTSPAILQAIQYGIVSSGTKFPVVVFAYFIGGIALACGLANHNYYICRIDKASVYLGFFHGSYGIGATIGPLVATVMLEAGIMWYYFFLVLVGVSTFNSFFLWWAFRDVAEDFSPFENQEELVKEAKSASSIELEDQVLSTGADVNAGADNESTNDILHTKSIKDVEGESVKLPSDFTLAVKLIKTWLISLFVFFYQGAEVGFGSWYVTFLLDYRHGKASSRYVASGFWFGVTVSRFLVTPLGVKYLGNRRSIIVLSLLVIAFDILAWFITDTVAAGFMASLVGFFLGPTYPLMIGLVTRILPRKVQVISMTIMSAFGSSGGALFPFLIGIMSQYFQTWILNPIFIALISFMLFMWILLPNVERIDKSGNPKNVWQRIW
ncbi:Bsc6 protein [Saccharomycopsis crataegensis]|uniref:Bsc6 protein n=1 Tax=Saccharomycopsis crataegensis TaxID=43959 RepID=A0AAV5QGD6_9ASCO|nr:Bsc6 protein [Saccharomycopsis crataegensis]